LVAAVGSVVFNTRLITPLGGNKISRAPTSRSPQSRALAWSSHRGFFYPVRLLELARPDPAELADSLCSARWRWFCSRTSAHLKVPNHDERRDGVWTIELTRFRVRPEMEQALLAARPGMLDEFRRDRGGFVDAQLVRLSGGEWLDIVAWRSPEDFAASRAKGANGPPIKVFFDLIDELVSSEEGELMTTTTPFRKVS
jgi:hypothetical protein